MKQLIEWLLDLDDIHLGGDAPLALKWDSPLEVWVVFCFAVLVLTWIAMTYRRERATTLRRIMLAALRSGLAALTVATICQPSLVLQRNRIEPSHAVVALDTSLSMATAENYRDEELALSIARGAGLEDPSALADHSRLKLIQNALVRDQAAPLEVLLKRSAIQLCTFSGEVNTRGFFAARQVVGSLVGLVESAEARGPTTDLAGAIHHIIEKAQGRRLAAIILATDGQATHPTSLKDALDLARDRQIPIFPVRIGSTERPRDIDVDPLRAQETVFVNDVLAVEAQVSARGLTQPTSVAVLLVDQRSGTTVASRQLVLDPAQDSISVELQTRPSQTGTVRYRVEVPPLPDEPTTENNVAQIDVTVLDDRLRILFVDGYPRYEYRYLKNALLREQTVDLSVLLIEADEQFVQEGTDPIRRFPETPEELNRYDVVLFGDVNPRGGWLTGAQMNMLLDFVGNKGGGFGLVAGERSAPYRFLGTPLERLLPIRIDPTFLGHYDTTLATGFRARLTPEGRRSRIFRFTADRAESERFFQALPELFWLARTRGPKPGASVLLEHPTSRSAFGPMPIVVTGRYGAGKLFFQATDDTWRWRRHTGELLHDIYWVKVGRELMPSSRVAQNRRLVLRTDRRVYPYGSPVQTQVEISDSQLLAEQGEVIQIVATEPQASACAGPNCSTMERGVPPAVVGRFDVHRLGPESNRYEGTWVAPRPGRFVIKAADITPRPGERVASAPVRIERPDLELRRPEANHETLERIAGATGGRVVELDRMEAVFGTIRDRSVQIPDDVTEPLWDSKLVLMLFAAMISMEWILRKVFGLM
ncbi:MAG: hypothetical protein JSU86_10175 [Phycisphaerales bacterium]|nr:MAG: hypothetical protein JSU86_10175 [Phycisphaerales bacterium]